MIRTGVVVALVAVSVGSLRSGPAPAANPLVGVWQIKYPAGARIENDTPTIITGSGRLTITTVGDSLVANLVPAPIEGSPAGQPVRFAAKATEGTVVFTQHATVRLNINGAEQKATSVSTWTLTANGDRLEGTVDRKVEGFDMPAAGPQPVTGAREKS
jgi:hypothetical protein